MARQGLCSRCVVDLLTTQTTRIVPPLEKRLGAAAAHWPPPPPLLERRAAGRTPNLERGDLAHGRAARDRNLAGSDPVSYGSLMELTWNGERPLQFADGTARTFLEDGHESCAQPRARRGQRADRRMSLASPMKLTPRTVGMNGPPPRGRGSRSARRLAGRPGRRERRPGFQSTGARKSLNRT
jgi:hypothetical protein